MAQIKIKIKKNGIVEMETDGFTGMECLSKSQPYKDALGIEDNARQALRAEAYLPEVENEESI